MITRRALLVASGVLLVLAAFSIWYVYAQEQYKWVVSLEPSETYPLAPITFKTYLYSSQLGEMYNVTCNLVLMNETDIIWIVNNITGAPAVYTFSIEEVGEYTLDYYCVSGEQEQYGSFSITINYPEPRLSIYKSLWGRPLEIGITTPYPYSNITLRIYFNDTVYNATLHKGKVDMTLEEIYAPSNVTVELFGTNTTFTITPTPPTLKLNLSSTQVKIVGAVTVTAYMEDSMGTLNISWPVSLEVDGPCRFENGEKTITAYTLEGIRVLPEKISVEATCTVKATAYPWPEMTLYADKEIRIVPPAITKFELLYSNETSWDYTFSVRVYLDTVVNGTLTLYINGMPVDEVKMYSTVFILTHSTTLDPGVYSIYATFRYLNVSLTSDYLVIAVPKHRLPIEKPPSQVYAGDEKIIPDSWLENGVYWWYQYLSNDTIIIYAEYPGSWYYYPESRVYIVKVIYPKIELHEDTITVENAAPGAIIEIYGYTGNTSELIMEIYCRRDNFTYALPSIRDWDYVVAIYKYGDYRLAVTGNDPETITVLTTRVLAGAPVVLLEESPKILYATIGEMLYTPGEKIVLKPGYYTLKVYTTDGYELEFPITVEPQQVKVAVYKEGRMWRIEVYAPENAVVHVVLANGRTLNLAPGTHYTGIEPVGAWYEYGEVQFMKFKTINPPCGCGG